MGALALGVATANAALAEESGVKVAEPVLEQITVVGKNLEGRTTSVGKMDAAITDIPFSVSVITQDFFTATGVKTLQDAFQYSAGVNGGPFGVDSRGDWATIRGVEPTLYLDGMRKSVGSYNNTRQDPYSLERVEILKGPASVGYGQASPGGIINMVSKRPQEEFGGEVWAQVGNFDRKQLAVDITGPIDEDGKWLYRLVALKKDADSQTEHVDDDSLIFMPSLTWKPTDQTSITVLVNEQKNETGTSTQFLPVSGTILPNPNGDIDQDTFLSEPDFDKYDSEQTAFTVSFEHEFNEIFSLSGNYRKSKSEVEYRTMYPMFFGGVNTTSSIEAQTLLYGNADYPGYMADGRTLLRTVLASDRSSDAETYDLRLKANFETGALEHNVVLGYDVQDITTDNDYSLLNDTSELAELYASEITDYIVANAVNPLAPTALEFAAAQGAAFGVVQGAIVQNPLDAYNPVYGQLSTSAASAIYGLTPTDRASNTVEQEGFYLMDKIHYENWILSAGIRRDKVENSTQGDSQKDKDEETTKQFGLMYQFDSGLSPYFSYTESFEPVTGLDASGQRYKPTEGEQREWGVKYQPEGTSLLFTAAYYDIQEENRTTADPLNPGFSIQTGGSEIRGYELEVQGTWSQVDLIASYTKLDAKHQEDGKDTVNISTIPEEQASAWVTYRFADELAGLRIGLGARYTGKTYDGTDNELLETDSYTLVDGMIGYELENWFISLNGRNLTDKEHLTSCLGRGDCFAGEARTVTADVRYKF
ncbi:TonB-dependent siderophore receptor [Maricurvus nonylphenolicus]